MAGTPFELKGKTVFVAGHGGMVGGALVRRLAQENVELQTCTHAARFQRAGGPRPSLISTPGRAQSARVRHERLGQAVHG
jgi:hypothetical protein